MFKIEISLTYNANNICLVIGLFLIITCNAILVLFDEVVILEQLKNTRGLKMWAVRAKKQWLGARCAAFVHFLILTSD